MGLSSRALVKSSLLAVGMLSLTAVRAQAVGLTPTGVSCDAGIVMASGTSFSDCAGAFQGNDTGSGNPLLTALNNGLFSGYNSNAGVWQLLGKSDEGAFKASETTSGNWSLLNGQSLNSPFVFSIKASTSFSAYLFEDAKNVTGGSFTTKGVSVNGKGNAQELSHASLFVFKPNTPVTPTPTAVPEPFTILGTAVAAGVGYTLKRRRAN